MHIETYIGLTPQTLGQMCNPQIMELGITNILNIDISVCSYKIKCKSKKPNNYKSTITQAKSYPIFRSYMYRFELIYINYIYIYTHIHIIHIYVYSTWAMLIIQLRNFGCNPACCFSLPPMGLLRVFNTSVPSFRKGRTITLLFFAGFFPWRLIYAHRFCSIFCLNELNYHKSLVSCFSI